MTPYQISKFDVDEVSEAIANVLIPKRTGQIKLQIPSHMQFRSVFLFIEAITTAPGEDFELQAELEFRRNGVPIHSMPCAIAENGGGAGVVQKTRVTAFANVAAGTVECLRIVLGNPLTGGQNDATVTPQKLMGEFDEIWLNVLGSRSATNQFSGWRAWLACRSSLEAM